jgi:hypothetical protein
MPEADIFRIRPDLRQPEKQVKFLAEHRDGIHDPITQAMVKTVGERLTSNFTNGDLGLIRFGEKTSIRKPYNAKGDTVCMTAECISFDDDETALVAFACDAGDKRTEVNAVKVPWGKKVSVRNGLYSIENLGAGILHIS